MAESIVEQIGDYYIEKCDGMYLAYSGYSYVVCYQPPTLCNPRQLAGFKLNELEAARKFLAKKAAGGAEKKKFENTKKQVERLLQDGFLPCSEEDDSHRAHLTMKGYSTSHKTGSTIWMRPPEVKK